MNPAETTVSEQFVIQTISGLKLSGEYPLDCCTREDRDRFLGMAVRCLRPLERYGGPLDV